MEVPCGTTISACQIGSPLCRALRSNTSATFSVLSSKFVDGLDGAEFCGFADRDLDLDFERLLEPERCLDLLFFFDRLLDVDRFFPRGLDADRLDADRFLEAERFREDDFFLDPERALGVSAFLDSSRFPDADRLLEESRAFDPSRFPDWERFLDAERRLEAERFLLEVDRFPERERFRS